MKYILGIPIICVFLISSCVSVGTKPTEPATQKPTMQYQCADGTIVDNLKYCRKIQDTNTIQEQVKSIIQGNLPADEQAREKNVDFTFSPKSIVSTQNGISLSLDDFKYEIKGDDWGKITTIDLSILNKGTNSFQPKVLVLLYDDESLKEEWTTPKAEIKFDIWSLGVNEHVTKSAAVNIPFHYLNLTKKFKLILTDDFDYHNAALAVVEKDLNATKNKDV